MAKAIKQLAILEASRPEFLASARAAAIQLANKHGSVTSDQLREVVHLPEGMNPSVFGCVFSKKSDWKILSFVKSARPASHGRYIKQFAYVGA